MGLFTALRLLANRSFHVFPSNVKESLKYLMLWICKTTKSIFVLFRRLACDHVKGKVSFYLFRILRNLPLPPTLLQAIGKVVSPETKGLNLYFVCLV